MANRGNEIMTETIENEHHLTLREIIQLKIENVLIRLEGMDKALVVKTTEMERRLIGLNELRSEVVRDREQFLKKDTYETRILGIDIWIADLNKRVAILETIGTTIETKMVGLNELRKEVVTDRERFVQKETYDIKTTNYDKCVADMQHRITVIETRSIVWSSVIVAAFTVIQLLLHYYKA